MKTTSLLCVAAVLAGLGAARAEQVPRGQIPTADVQSCVQTDKNNSSNIEQNSDVNMAACIQVGRNNESVIRQNGSRNTARNVQGQLPQ